LHHDHKSFVFNIKKRDTKNHSHENGAIIEKSVEKVFFSFFLRNLRLLEKKKMSVFVKKINKIN